MRKTVVTLPELGLIAATRGMLGAGLGLLFGDRLPESQRKAVGWTLFLVGAFSTIPLALEVFGRHDRRHQRRDHDDQCVPGPVPRIGPGGPGARRPGPGAPHAAQHRVAPAPPVAHRAASAAPPRRAARGHAA